MNIAELRALLQQKVGALTDLKAKGLAAGATAEDRKALKDALDEIKTLEEQLELAEADEALQAKYSKPATQPAGTKAEDAPTVFAAPKVEDFGQKLAIFAASTIIAGKNGDPIQVLKDEGYEGLINETLAELNVRAKRKREKSVNTLVSGEGGILVPTPLNGGIIPLLRNETTFLQGGPMRVQFTGGKYIQPRGATGATAAYIAQGALKPVSAPTFDSINMAAKKLAGIVPITKEAAKWTVGNLEAYIRDDLRQALAQTMDLNLWFGTGSGAAPTGILAKSGIQTVTGTFSSATAPTLAELDTFANAMILKLTTANLISRGKWRWLMSYRTVMKLGSMRVGDNDGDLAFPEIGLGNGTPTWKGFPVLVSNQVATNLGTGTDETTIALVDFSHVLFGEEETISMRMSDQATLDVDGAGELLHLWQQNMFAILAESEHDVGLRYAKAVVKATGIRF